PAIAFYQAGATESGIRRIAARIDDNDRQAGRLEVLQDPPSDTSQPTQNDWLFHGFSKVSGRDLFTIIRWRAAWPWFDPACLRILPLMYKDKADLTIAVLSRQRMTLARATNGS